MPKDTYTLGEAFEYFRAQSNLSPRTLETYAYAFQHFLAFLEHSKNAVLLSVAGPSAADRALNALGGQAQDVNLLAWFVNYLGQEVERAHADRSATRARDRRLEPATVRLYAQAVITWFGFLADELLLPDRFPTAAAIARANRRLRTYVPRTMARESAPEPPEGMEALLRAFDSPQIDNSLPTKEQHRLKLEALRNRALIYAASQTHGESVSRIFLLGGIARWVGADAFLQKMIELPVQIIPNPLKTFPARKGANTEVEESSVPEIAVAAGLALRGMVEHD